jgi:trehalose 6-phosphate synthase
MSRLVIVSNRVGDLKNPTQTGGLAVAVADALKKQGGVWFGWDGETTPSSAATPKGPLPVAVEEIGNVTQIVASLSEQDYEDYYVGYANSVLWPLFHYRLDLVEYSQAFFKGYLKVNSAFAASLQPFLRGDDRVWVHDYHLIPFARYLRKLGCRQRIGFFLHIPFPPPEIVAGSPNHAAIVEALLEYDVIGFQTSTDVSNFRRYVQENDMARIGEDGTILVDGRTVLTDRFPIGIDVDAFHEMARHAPEDVRIDQMRRGILGRKQIIGVDRLDYSKGIPARFQAFERLLLEHPEMEKGVSLLQIAPPTREAISAYADIRTELEGLAGAINGRFAEFDWTPIRYIHRSVPRDKLASIYRFSQVCLVTPLRDGMNLVAKEYVAAQDAENPGVLVLSQFAGAAEEMSEALIVNPHDIDEMARSLHAALTMPLPERCERHRALLGRIRRYDVDAWAGSFLKLLADEADTKAFAQSSAA